MLRIAIYSRKSVDTGKGESIENQIEMCRQYVLARIANATETAITVYEDEGFSAKNVDRPQFQQMLRAIRKQHYDYVVCYRLDRISRNVSDFATLIEELNARHIAFICIKEEFDTSKPMGKAMMYIASVFAQLERETIAERVRDNMMLLARTGRWLGGSTPTGFTSKKVVTNLPGGKAHTAYSLTFVPAEIATVKIIFDKFLALRTLSGVSKYLIAQDITSRSGKLFSLSAIREILTNPVYCIADPVARQYFLRQNADVCFTATDCSATRGLLSYNKRDYKKKPSPRQPPDQWIIAVGGHDGIISGEKWVAIQQLLAGNKSTTPSIKAHNTYALLSGLLTCTACQGKMFAKARHGRDTFDYICNSKLRGGVALCATANLNGLRTDQEVWTAVQPYTAENARILSHLAKLQVSLQKQDDRPPLEALECGIRKCNAELDNLVNALAQPLADAAFIGRVNARVAQLQQQLQHLTAQRDQQQASLASASHANEIAHLAHVLSDLQGNFNALSASEQRRFMQLLVEKITWDGQALHIFIKSYQAIAPLSQLP